MSQTGLENKTPDAVLSELSVVSTELFIKNSSAQECHIIV